MLPLFRVLKKVSLLFVLMCMSVQTSFALPKLDATGLPFMKNAGILKDLEILEKENPTYKDLIDTLSKIVVRQDNRDPSQYYITPPYIIYSKGKKTPSATMTINDEVLDTISSIDSLQQQLQTTNNNYEDAIEQLELNAMRASLEQKENIEASIKQLKKKQSREMASLRDSLSWSLAKAGFDYDQDEVKNDLFSIRRNLTKANAGFIVANVFSGYSPKEWNAISALIHISAEHNVPLKIDRLPLRDIRFESLSETMLGQNPDKKTLSILDKDATPLFQQITGTSDGISGIINIDLTVNGAKKYSIAPNPTTLPIVIKAKLLHRPAPFKIALDCNFESGWSAVSAPVMGSGFLFDLNHIPDIIKDEYETGNKPCTMKRVGGDPSRDITRAEKLEAAATEFMHLIDTQQAEIIKISTEQKNAFYEENKKHHETIKKDTEEQEDKASKSFGEYVPAIGKFLEAAIGVVQKVWISEDSKKAADIAKAAVPVVENSVSKGAALTSMGREIVKGVPAPVLAGVAMAGGNLAMKAIGSFHVHFKKNNIHMSSTIDIKKRFIDNTNVLTEIPILGNEFCIAFNPRTKNYIACGEDELSEANSPTDAYYQAKIQCASQKGYKVDDNECREMRIANKNNLNKLGHMGTIKEAKALELVTDEQFE